MSSFLLRGFCYCPDVWGDSSMSTHSAVLVCLLSVLCFPGGSAQAGEGGWWGTPTNLTELNSEALDGAPKLSPDGLTVYFVSDRTGGAGLWDIWYAERASTSDPWGTPQNVTELNTEGYDMHPYASPDGLTLYFASDRSGTVGTWDLWYSTRASAADPWGSPVNIAEANSSFVEYGPNLSSNGLTLYFASDRDGGVGLLDLWYVTRATTSDPWGAPTNLSELSSSERDWDPDVSADGLTLRFSSDRAGGAGLADIWMATRASTSDPWGTPVNISALNTDQNETCAHLLPDGQTLSFASDRPGGLGNYDIYVSLYTVPEPCVLALAALGALGVLARKRR
jgi:Tol biopolymer transport system component